MPGIPDQYRIINAGAGWRRKSERGRLRFTGKDRASFLQALLTNDLDAIGPGEGQYAAYLTAQGRMIADLHVFVRAEETLADVPVTKAADLSTAFDRLIFTEDVGVTNVTESVSQLAVAGGQGPDILGRAFHIDAGALRGLEVWCQLDVRGGFVVRTDDTPGFSFDVIVSADTEARALESILAAGATAISDELWTAMRVDAGRPQFGIDMSADTIPLEAGLLDRAISTTKGCYVGQEVVIRVLHRGGGRVARRLVKIAFDADISRIPAAGTALHVDTKDIGRLTTVSRSLEGSGIVALGYVHRDLAEVGHAVEVFGDKPLTGQIIAIAG